MSKERLQELSDRIHKLEKEVLDIEYQFRTFLNPAPDWAPKAMKSIDGRKAQIRALEREYDLLMEETYPEG